MRAADEGGALRGGGQGPRRSRQSFKCGTRALILTTDRCMFAHPSAGFKVVAGDCELSGQLLQLSDGTVTGACVSSPNFLSGGNYSNDQSCEIVPAGRGLVTAESFDTDEKDVLAFVGLNPFAGDGLANGPNEATVTSATLIQWSSDASLTRSGWKICAEPCTPRFPSLGAPRLQSCVDAHARTVTLGTHACTHTRTSVRTASHAPPATLAAARCNACHRAACSLHAVHGGMCALFLS